MAELKRGWSSAGLKVVAQDDLSYWSTSDAVMLLGPDLRADQVRSLIRLAGIEPAGKRRNPSRKSGRYVRVYTAIDLIRAYEAVITVVDSSAAMSESPQDLSLE